MLGAQQGAAAPVLGSQHDRPPDQPADQQSGKPHSDSGYSFLHGTLLVYIRSAEALGRSAVVDEHPAESAQGKLKVAGKVAKGARFVGKKMLNAVRATNHVRSLLPTCPPIRPSHLTNHGKRSQSPTLPTAGSAKAGHPRAGRLRGGGDSRRRGCENELQVRLAPGARLERGVLHRRLPQRPQHPPARAPLSTASCPRTPHALSRTRSHRPPHVPPPPPSPRFRSRTASSSGPTSTSATSWCLWPRSSAATSSAARASPS